MTTWEIIIGLVASVGVAPIVKKEWDKRFPSKRDNTKEFNQTTSTIATAMDINTQLNLRLDALVEEKTQVLQNILMRRELEYTVQIQDYSKKIYESQEDNKKLRKENLELQKQILACYKELETERILKEQHFTDLQDAKRHILKLEERVSELELINKK